MAEADRVRTLVKNLTDRRRVSWMPPNGREMGDQEQVSVDGVLENIVVMGMDAAVFDQYVYDLANDRVEITKLGYAGGGEEETESFTTVVGDGSETVFDIDAGFNTANARVFVYDTISGSQITAYQFQLQTPTTTSVRLTFNPAPAAGQIRVFIFSPSTAEGETYDSGDIGNGADTEFVLDLGFPAALADIYVFDALGGGPIFGYSLQRATPTLNSITVGFSPAPASGQIRLFAFERS